MRPVIGPCCRRPIPWRTESPGAEGHQVPPPCGSGQGRHRPLQSRTRPVNGPTRTLLLPKIRSEHASMGIPTWIGTLLPPEFRSEHGDPVCNLPLLLFRGALPHVQGQCRLHHPPGARCISGWLPVRYILAWYD
jgi:hypothetical protein